MSYIKVLENTNTGFLLNLKRFLALSLILLIPLRFNSSIWTSKTTVCNTESFSINQLTPFKKSLDIRGYQRISAHVISADISTQNQLKSAPGYFLWGCQVDIFC